MKLSQILSQVKTKFKISGNVDNIHFTDIALDSRLVKRGAVFFALDGKTQNGEKFIADAISNGAVAVVSRHANNSTIVTDEPFALLVEFLQIFYSPLPANIYAVTGTNGKTSVAEFTRQILGFLGKKSASIGSLGTITDVKEFKNDVASDLTTPDLVSFYKTLYNLKKVGVDDVAIEASSIGLEQGRIAGVDIAVAAFTNFSQDHLDYHKSMDDYFDCKMILFEKDLVNQGVAVLNSDIEEFEKIKNICEARKIKIIEYGFKARDISLIEVLDQEVVFEFKQKKYNFELAVSGDFQVFNVLCALGNILAKYELSDEELKNLLIKFSDLHAAAGRMQPVAKLANNAQIFIDHAHKPAALENVLKSARRIAKGRVLVLFGCGGNRDAIKRPIMGRIACDLADVVIVTDDNPRNEQPQAIRVEILAGCDMKKTIEIDNRRVAIEKAINMLQDGDILILAGKGHEKYQIIGERKLEFDEEEIVKNII